jgi:uncharacterized membrane protein
MRKSELLIFIIILLSFAISLYLYPQLPEKMVSHWNTKGEVDGYTSKFWGLFLMPIILIGFWLLFILIPRIDPLKENIEKFRKYFDGFILLITLFFIYLYSLTIFWNLGVRFDMGQFLTPALGLLFVYCGFLVENAKRNWFIGIRTPWTLSSDKVWEKTHKLGGKLFKIAGVITILGLFFPKYAFSLVVFPVLLLAIYTIFYSYFEYRREIKIVK